MFPSLNNVMVRNSSENQAVVLLLGSLKRLTYLEEIEWVQHTHTQTRTLTHTPVQPSVSCAWVLQVGLFEDG